MFCAFIHSFCGMDHFRPQFQSELYIVVITSTVVDQSSPLHYFSIHPFILLKLILPEVFVNFVRHVYNMVTYLRMREMRIYH